MTGNKLPCVFVDTNRLLGEDLNGDAWQQLLRLHNSKSVMICLPRIVCSEWASNIRDDFISCSVKAKSNIEKQQKALKNNPLYMEVSDTHLIHNVPKIEDLMVSANNTAERYVANFVETNTLCIVDISGAHVNEVFRKFFSWNPPFDTAKTPEDFHNEGSREARKKNIPDAFIVEAILDYEVDPIGWTGNRAGSGWSQAG